MDCILWKCFVLSTLLKAGVSKNTNCDCGRTNAPGVKILGGSFYSGNRYPFLAGIAYNTVKTPKNKIICGGSIITNRHVLTAAHCADLVHTLHDTTLEDAWFYVMLGFHDRSRTEKSDVVIRVKNAIVHPKYNPNNGINDIAIMVLEKTMSYNGKVGPVCMPPRGLQVPLEEPVKLMGWGIDNPSSKGFTASPKELDTNIGPSVSECRRLWATDNLRVPSNWSVVCTLVGEGDEIFGSGEGDSGGPLVWNDPQTDCFTQIGIVSIGGAYGIKTSLPDVSTSVVFFLDWIHNITRGSELCHRVPHKAKRVKQ